jgi:hypothetical protein
VRREVFHLFVTQREPARQKNPAEAGECVSFPVAEVCSRKGEAWQQILLIRPAQTTVPAQKRKSPPKRVGNSIAMIPIQA